MSEKDNIQESTVITEEQMVTIQVFSDDSVEPEFEVDIPKSSYDLIQSKADAAGVSFDDMFKKIISDYLDKY